MAGVPERAGGDSMTTLTTAQHLQRAHVIVEKEGGNG